MDVPSMAVGLSGLHGVHAVEVKTRLDTERVLIKLTVASIVQEMQQKADHVTPSVLVSY